MTIAGPNQDFWWNYYDDPQLHLPPGMYRIFAESPLHVGDCGGDRIDLTASIIVRVH